MPLHFAAPPTPEQADSAKAYSWVSRPVGRRIRLFCGWLKGVVPAPNNPFQPPTIAKGITHDRQRYNTLDFAGKVVCHETAGFIGFFPPGRLCPPLDSTRQGSAAAFGNHCKGNAVPFGFPSQQGAPRPYWMIPSQRNCHPFGIPARFEMSTHKWKMVCGHSSQNEKNPQSFI